MQASCTPNLLAWQLSIIQKRHIDYIYIGVTVTSECQQVYLIMYYVIYELNEETKGGIHSPAVINSLNTLKAISLLAALLTVIFAYATFIRGKKATEKENMDATLYRKKLEENIGKLQQVNQ